MDLIVTMFEFYIIGSTVLFLFSDVFLACILITIFFRKSFIQSSSNNDTNTHSSLESPNILIPDIKLPILTILLPVYKEPLHVIHNLIKSILESDYPMQKLDIRFLVEYDDTYTLNSMMRLTSETCREYDHAGVLRRIRIRDGMAIEIDYNSNTIKTKGGALNVGLHHAKGSFVVVYDAEDRPDHKQMKIAISYLMTHPDVACVIGRVLLYNSEQSLITRFFSIEFLHHFLVYVPAYKLMRNVIPLSGNTFFMRVEHVRELGGWDPMNVTEDIDLGVRLYRRGYVIAPLEIVTWEEAPAKIYSWIRQRSRWNKGFLYTLIKQFRNPLWISKDLGLKSTLCLLFTLMTPIINAISFIGWLLFAVYLLDWLGLISFKPLVGWINVSFHSYAALLYLALFTFAFGQFYNTVESLEGIFIQDDYYSLKKVKFVFLLPLYSIVVGLAGVLSIGELIFKPKAWYRTQHGISIEQGSHIEI
jgi:glycosyltransferase XagB